MTVFCDNMEARFGTMTMCHCIADTEEELLAMMVKIGVNVKWIQHKGRHDFHFDIAKSKRKLAIENGAVEITWRQYSAMIRRRKEIGELGDPLDAWEWLRQWHLTKGGSEIGEETL